MEKDGFYPKMHNPLEYNFEQQPQRQQHTNYFFDYKEDDYFPKIDEYEGQVNVYDPLARNDYPLQYDMRGLPSPINPRYLAQQQAAAEEEYNYYAMQYYYQPVVQQAHYQVVAVAYPQAVLTPQERTVENYYYDTLSYGYKPQQVVRVYYHMAQHQQQQSSILNYLSSNSYVIHTNTGTVATNQQRHNFQHNTTVLYYYQYNVLLSQYTNHSVGTSYSPLTNPVSNYAYYNYQPNNSNNNNNNNNHLGNYIQYYMPYETHPVYNYPLYQQRILTEDAYYVAPVLYTAPQYTAQNGRNFINSNSYEMGFGREVLPEKNQAPSSKQYMFPLISPAEKTQSPPARQNIPPVSSSLSKIMMNKETSNKSIYQYIQNETAAQVKYKQILSTPIKKSIQKKKSSYSNYSDQKPSACGSVGIQENLREQLESLNIDCDQLPPPYYPFEYDYQQVFKSYYYPSKTYLDQINKQLPPEFMTKFSVDLEEVLNEPGLNYNTLARRYSEGSIMLYPTLSRRCSQSQIQSPPLLPTQITFSQTSVHSQNETMLQLPSYLELEYQYYQQYQQQYANKYIGTLSSHERRIKIQKYLEKRKRQRIYQERVQPKQTQQSKVINYDCRKKVADYRLRFKGRFVTKNYAIQILGDSVVCSENRTDEELREILLWKEHNPSAPIAPFLSRKSTDLTMSSEHASGERQTQDYQRNEELYQQQQQLYESQCEVEESYVQQNEIKTEEQEQKQEYYEEQYPEEQVSHSNHLEDYVIDEKNACEEYCSKENLELAEEEIPAVMHQRQLIAEGDSLMHIRPDFSKAEKIYNTLQSYFEAFYPKNAQYRGGEEYDYEEGEGLNDSRSNYAGSSRSSSKSSSGYRNSFKLDGIEDKSL